MFAWRRIASKLPQQWPISARREIGVVFWIAFGQMHPGKVAFVRGAWNGYRWVRACLRGHREDHRRDVPGPRWGDIARPVDAAFGSAIAVVAIHAATARRPGRGVANGGGRSLVIARDMAASARRRRCVDHAVVVDRLLQ